MKKFTTIAAIVLLVTGNLFSQEEAITKDGKTVMLNQDGTWKYIEKVVEQPIESKTDCEYTTNEVDEFTGNEKVIVKEEVFLTHTEESMKKYMKNRDYTTCKTYCAKIGGLKVLYVYWKLLTKEAYKYYGTIQKSAGFTIKLTNGEMMNLKYDSYDSGDANYKGGYTTYSSYIILSDEDIDKLTSNEVDKVRMSWSKGYQDYEITNKRFFINQLPCVK